jgi:hypothetical protein
MTQTESVSGSIACGVPVFSRTDALKQFLDSVPAYVTTVYIADNGHTEDRQHLYQRDWAFDLDVLDLEYDAGIAACRYAITEAVTEPYLFMGDNDMEFVDSGDLRRLRSILESNPGLGGACGWLLEEGTVRAGARNLHEHGGKLFKDVTQEPEIEGDELPFARFEFVPQAGVFRTEIYDDYTYDPAVGSSEHGDFILGHRELTEWEFASTPAVLVKHNRWVDPEYRESDRGSGRLDRTLIEDKWGYDAYHPGSAPDWVEYNERSIVERSFSIFRDSTPPGVWVPVRRVLKRVVG